MNVRMVSLDSVIPYVNNPRNNKNAIDKVASSIKEFGFKVPIVVDKDNVIITGHTRLLASQKLGLKEVPVIMADDLTDAQVKAFRIADNKVSEFAEWDNDLLAIEFEQLKELDFDLELTGFNLDEMDFGIEETGEYSEEDDVVEEPPAVPYSKRGDVWLLGKHRLMCGSSTEEEDVKVLMDGNKADLLVTDPPYNVAYEGKTKDALTIQNDKMNNDNFYQFLYDFYINAYNVLNDGCGFYIFHADTEGVNFRSALVNAGFKLAQCCVWVKNSMVMGRQDFHWQHEPCLYGWKPTSSHKWYTDRKQTTVWEFDRPTRNAEHPTMKPVPLIEYCINNSSRVGDIVLDCFGGSGTTLIASEINNRTNYSMELDEKYVDVIVKRYMAHKGNGGEDVKLIREDCVIDFADIEGEFYGDEE